MDIEIESTTLSRVIILKPKRHRDNRGFFTETYHKDKYADAGITVNFVQDNVSFSFKNILRGLHYQLPHPQAKLIHVLRGSIFDVAVDIRPASPTFAKWAGIELSADNGYQIFIPEGYAHGYFTLSDKAIVTYKCSDFYHPEDEGGIYWADPYIAIAWPSKNPILSEKDSSYPSFNDIPHSKLQNYL